MARDEMDEFLDERDPAEQSTRRSRRPRRGRRILYALLALIGLVGVAVLGYGFWINRTLDKGLVAGDLLPGQGSNADPKKAGGNGKWKYDKKNDRKDLVSGEGENYLFIGSDARPGLGGARSDVMILAHINKAKNRVDLIHFPRDTWVPIPGHGNGKLNWAFAYGGSPLLVQTMQNVLGIQVDHVAWTGFDGFKAMTDELGGVDVYAAEGNDAKGNGGTAISQGYNHLNGEQALAFVRERYELSGGDLSRGQRQMQWIKAIIAKVSSPSVLLNPARFNSVLSVGLNNTIVDSTLTPSFIRSEALSLRGLRPGNVYTHTAPNGGTGWAGSQSIVVYDSAGMARLAKALATDSMASF